MKKLWLIRKDQEAVSPVIATILMVAITVVLAAVLYVMLTSFTPTGGGGGKTIGLTKMDAGSNYKLLVASSSAGLALATTAMTVANTTGFKTTLNNIPLATLATAPWGTYKAQYIKVASETEVVVGSYVLLDKATYKTGFGYSFSDGTSILAQGTF